MNQQNPTVVERWKDKFVAWIHDPFGRKQIMNRHREVLGEMREVKTLVKTTTTKYETQKSFPIGDMVGSRNLRRKRKTHGDA